jgi:hypothetical protein
VPGETVWKFQIAPILAPPCIDKKGTKPVLPPRVGEKYDLDATLTIFQPVSEAKFSEVHIQDLA